MSDETFDPSRFPRLGPAWLAAAELLSDGAWHSLSDLREVMLANSDVLPETCSGILTEGARKRLLEKRCGAKKRRYYRVAPTRRVDFDRLVRVR